MRDIKCYLLHGILTIVKDGNIQRIKKTVCVYSMRDALIFEFECKNFRVTEIEIIYNDVDTSELSDETVRTINEHYNRHC